MAALPVREVQDLIVSTVKANRVTVVMAETGSGKTTQIPQILLEAGMAESGGIAVTQPRRVAAVSVARRVAEERRCSVGQEVGFAIRFEQRCSSETRILYLTDGMLMRECLVDDQLSKYAVIVLDEAHERTLNTDILFGVLKSLVQTREQPLHLVVTSATLDGDKFSSYFRGCPVLTIPGRCFPVQLSHLLEAAEQPYLQLAVDKALDLHLYEEAGDILVFLTGQAEIEQAVAEITSEIANMPEHDACPPAIIIPLYAALPPEQQARVFEPAPDGCRRIIVATNVAETSITVDGVVYVVDTGVVKQKAYDPHTGMETLTVTSISKVQAIQRSGRAGRTRPGKCFRLYTRADYDQRMPAETVPEILRTSLQAAVLHLKTLPLQVDVLHFDYMDAPKRGALEDALRHLYLLGALTREGAITPLGRLMAQLPWSLCWHAPCWLLLSWTAWALPSQWWPCSQPNPFSRGTEDPSRRKAWVIMFSSSASFRGGRPPTMPHPGAPTRGCL
ncbi:hypothetical protein WJX73_008521 [Symbiochloris irregularis]|uniref:RNA helicase n=1 Tax=Symbiochloris irregularis TaxID=706552 RepID=A0AAW1P1F8_9CHLO